MHRYRGDEWAAGLTTHDKIRLARGVKETLVCIPRTPASPRSAYTGTGLDTLLIEQQYVHDKGLASEKVSRARTHA
jgi:hypothetical protein